MAKIVIEVLDQRLSEFTLQGDGVGAGPSSASQNRIPDPLPTTLANIEQIRMAYGISSVSVSDDPKGAGKALAASLEERFKRSLANIDAMRQPHPFLAHEPQSSVPSPHKQTQERSIIFGLSAAVVALTQIIISRDETAGPELIGLLSEASDMLQFKQDDEIAARIVENLIAAIEALSGRMRLAS